MGAPPATEILTTSTRPSAMTRGVALRPREDGVRLMKCPQPDWIRSRRRTSLHDLMRVDEIGRTMADFVEASRTVNLAAF